MSCRNCGQVRVLKLAWARISERSKDSRQKMVWKWCSGARFEVGLGVSVFKNSVKTASNLDPEIVSGARFEVGLGANVLKNRIKTRSKRNQTAFQKLF